MDTIDEYCRNVPCFDSVLHIEQILKEAGVLEIMLDFIDLFIWLNDKKRNCLWINGKSNSGKTELTKCLMEIFHHYEW